MHYVSNVKVEDPVVFLVCSKHCFHVVPELEVARQVLIGSVSARRCKRSVAFFVLEVKVLILCLLRLWLIHRRGLVHEFLLELLLVPVRFWPDQRRSVFVISQEVSVRVLPREYLRCANTQLLLLVLKFPILHEILLCFVEDGELVLVDEQVPQVLLGFCHYVLRRLLLILVEHLVVLIEIVHLLEQVGHDRVAVLDQDVEQLSVVLKVIVLAEHILNLGDLFVD